MSSDSEEFYDLDEQDVTIVAGDKYHCFLYIANISRKLENELLATKYILCKS